MARINLRPWREELRAERQKSFVTALIGVLIISAGLSFLWVRYMEGQIESQNNRNSFLTTQISQLNEQIKEINELKKRREALIDRMRVIQDLQGKRPVIVRLFDELVRITPDGVFLEKLARTNDAVAVTGVGESNSRISTFMRNLDQSEWFKDPSLSNVKTKPNSDSLRQFDLRVTEESPAVKAEGDKS
ncbi:PilN domain-containing protein [Allohahella sp. A8]|uniref:PilN domain-containing protein n=1 Tax=Allohahella sp. A8 TaxID=3141461 RepID=UPI000C0A6FB4|nr:pilus assembly protein PilN [Hahellaceae bacterium]|tara:strand:- start:31983 stop:32549 length:567 start_codon:yes stop_codon:yes gene_type:complete